jgi:protein-disulfide isomerase/uncharacterized membrane protein
MKNKKLLPYIAIIFTIASFLILSYLSVKHYQLKSGTIAEGSACNINETFNCDAVSASTYSEFLSIPMSVWGLMTQLSLLLLLVIYTISASPNANRMAFFLSAINVIAVVIMGVISVTYLNTYCLFCLFSYATILISFFCVWKLQDDYKWSTFLGEQKIYLAFLVVVPAGAFIINDKALGEAYRNIEKNLSFYILQWQKSPEKQIPALESVSYGASAETAKMTIVEFADFNCIHCKHAAPVLHSFVKSHPSTRLLFYHFPLDGACNPSIPRQGVSCDMAKAVFCGHKLSTKGWDSHQAMFETEKPQTLEEATALVSTKAGIATQELSACISDPATKTAIEMQAKLGTELGVQGTPAIFVNNKLLTGGNLMPVLKEAYKSLQ